MRMTEELSILANPDILNEHYIPPNIPGREAQITELTDCLSPAFKRKKPIHSWLFGKPGVGKTLIATYILEKIEREGNVKGVYINCWECNSYYSVLDKIVRELRILGAEKLNSAFKMERLTKFIGKSPFIIVLYEIDQPNPKERETILYNLSGIGNVGLICICNSRYILMIMDDGIKSRLALKQIEFLPYSDQDLLYILKQRANFALHPDSWNKETLGKIAELAEGDARVAIQTLKNAAYNAENDLSSKIKNKHIENAYNSAKDIKKTYLLNKLTEHHRILHGLIKKAGEIKSGVLWLAYMKECRKLGK